jgi:hypothetical protein
MSAGGGCWNAVDRSAVRQLRAGESSHEARSVEPRASPGLVPAYRRTLRSWKTWSPTATAVIKEPVSLTIVKKPAPLLV